MKVVLAYSGGLDTSVAIKWLEEKYDARVVTLTVDVGQQEDLKAIAEKAKMLGVERHYSIDAKAEFAKDYIYPSIKANGLYEGKYPLSTALARPLIASKLVEIALKEKADAVAHGCTGKGNDQVRFDVTVKALAPQLKVIAPVREWNLSREEEIKYAKERGVPVEEKKSVFSIDQNLWGRSIESGPLEQPDFEPPEDAFEWVKPLSKTPDEPGYVELGFEDGVPVSIDGSEMAPIELISSLNKKAGLHGVGVIDHIEDRLVGIKSREVYECPAAVCILEAHRDLEKMVLTRHQLMFKELVDREWAWLVYTGLWVEPLRRNLDAFIDSTQKAVNGSVRLKLYKGGLRVVGRKAKRSLYDIKLATYDKTSVFQQKAAEGFINLWGLPSVTAYQLSEK
ncbi:MAG: argininosuccinate synthase [Thaumarchaeota archaeon]|jgi:argininosuccinate synthase|nr:argininosuccinate synthase [Nitrososphaerota archaeon]